MCKPLSQVTTQRDREIRRMQVAAECPGVAEFGSLFADARRLAFRISNWLEQNPANRRTETIAALKVAMEVTDCDEVSEAHRVLTSLGWMLESSSSVVISTLLPQVFPECFEDLETVAPAAQPASKPTTRKPSSTQCPALSV